jgi:hypothetical protein
MYDLTPQHRPGSERTDHVPPKATPVKSPPGRRISPVRPSSVPLRPAPGTAASNAADHHQEPGPAGTVRQRGGQWPGYAVVQPSSTTVLPERGPTDRRDLETTVPGLVRAALRGLGSAIEESQRHEMESRFGHDFSRVRIHDGDTADAAVSVLGVTAYTVGRDIVLGHGAPALRTSRGRAVLAHELAHVVQQERGGGAPLVGPNLPHEQDADAAAFAAVSGMGPVTVRASTGVGLACAPQDWLTSPPDLTLWSGDRLFKERDQLQRWLDNTKTSLHEFLVIHDAVMKLTEKIWLTSPPDVTGWNPAKLINERDLLQELLGQTNIPSRDFLVIKDELLNVTEKIWLTSSPDLTGWDPAQLIRDRDLLRESVRSRTSSSRESSKIDDALMKLAGEITRRSTATSRLDMVIDFQTAKTKLGDLDVHFTGYLSIHGPAALISTDIPSTSRGRAKKPTQQNISGGAAGLVRASAKPVLDAQTPTGTARHVELYIGDEMLVLDLAQDFTGLPPFVVSGQFKGPAKNLAFGGATLPKASVGLYVTAWITPTPSPPGSRPQSLPGDQAVTKFTWAGQDANFRDTYYTIVRKKEVAHPRTGAIAMQDSLLRFDKELPDFVRGHKYLRLPEQRVAFFQEMRSYFGSDERIIAHFKQLRHVKQKGTESELILHDEAARRFEAVGQELGPEYTPTTKVGWPRAECSLGGTREGDRGLFDLHTIGFAVDFNATEMPHFKADLRLKDLVRLVTSRLELPLNLREQAMGDYEDMVKKHAEQRGVMADPDPTSKLGQLIADVEEAAQDASYRSEVFRSSVDAKEMADLRKTFIASNGDERIWGPEQKERLEKVTQPWKKIIKEQLAGSNEAIEATGFSRDELEDLEKALDDPGWVLGKDKETKAIDPPPAQLVDLGFFTLTPYSHSATGNAPQPGAFDVAFIGEMAKHGFMYGGTWSTPDFMHFELRWYGPIGPKGLPPGKPKPP